MKTILSFAFIFIATVMIAQDGGDVRKFNVTWGAPYEIPKKHTDQGYIGNLKDGLVQISERTGRELCLQRFDPMKMNKTMETIIDMSVMPTDYMPEIFKEMNGKYYMFYSTWDKPNRKEHLFVQELDIQKCAFKGKGQEVIACNQVTGTLVASGFYSFKTANKFQFNTSFDKSKILITYRLKPEVRDDAVSKDIIGFYVYDEKMQKVWNKEIRMPHTEEMMDNKDWSIDSRGNAYMLAKVYDQKRKEAKDGKPNYHYEVLKVTANSSSMQIIKVSLEQKFINELYVTEDVNHDMVLGGYYRNELKGDNTDGAFIVKIDETGTVSKVKKGYYEFPLEVLKQFEKERTQKKIDRKEKKDDAEIPDLDMRKLILSDDGSIMLIGEQYLVIAHTRYSNGRSYTYYTYHYLDIYAMKIAADGELAWVRKIPKNQEGSNGKGTMSFSYFSINDNHYFFYLDNIKNLDIAFNEAPARAMDGRGGFLTVSKIDAKGSQSKGKLFDVRDEDVKIWPSNFDFVGTTTILGRAYGDRESKMMRIEYKQ